MPATKMSKRKRNVDFSEQYSGSQREFVLRFEDEPPLVSMVAEEILQSIPRKESFARTGVTKKVADTRRRWALVMRPSRPL